MATCILLQSSRPNERLRSRANNIMIRGGVALGHIGNGMDPLRCTEPQEKNELILLRICKLMWTNGEWPTDWCRAVFISLPKKGNLNEWSNDRTISLIVHASKVLLKIIKYRIKLHYDRVMAEEQDGFVDGTREQMVNIRVINSLF